MYHTYSQSKSRYGRVQADESICSIVPNFAALVGRGPCAKRSESCEIRIVVAIRESAGRACCGVSEARCDPRARLLQCKTGRASFQHLHKIRPENLFHTDGHRVISAPTQNGLRRCLKVRCRSPRDRWRLWSALWDTCPAFALHTYMSPFRSPPRFHLIYTRLDLHDEYIMQ
jgi:hypothetical protein